VVYVILPLLFRVEYTAVGTLPQGAILDSRTGEFTWKPNYEQAGEHVLKFQAKDPGGAITSSTGETIRFVKDATGRLQQITAPDGSLVRYTYEGGNLVAARNLSTGNASRYGYTDSLLTLASGNPGTPGSAIAYGATPQILAVKGDLGGAVQWNGQSNSGVGNERYTFSLRDSELSSTAEGIVLVAVDVTGGGDGVI
jgi:YD repeat-containing protein